MPFRTVAIGFDPQNISILDATSVLFAVGRAEIVRTVPRDPLDRMRSPTRIQIVQFVSDFPIHSECDLYFSIRPHFRRLKHPRHPPRLQVAIRFLQKVDPLQHEDRYDFYQKSEWQRAGRPRH